MAVVHRSVVRFAVVALSAAVFGITTAPVTNPATFGSRITTVLVTARDFSFTLSRVSVAVGTTRFVVTNSGVLPHDFEIAGRRTRVLKQGERATIVVHFRKAGRYPYRCSIPGQRDLGMRGVVVVSKPGSGGAGPPPPPAPTALYVDQRNPNCSDLGSAVVGQPFCKIAPAASR